MRIRDNSLRPICKIDMSGMLAVMIVLVVMFFPTSVPDLPVGPSVDQQRVVNDRALREALREDAMTIAVQRDGKLFFENDRVSPELLPARIQAALHAGAHDTVYL